jgi:hypothetical protein
MGRNKKKNYGVGMIMRSILGKIRKKLLRLVLGKEWRLLNERIEELLCLQQKIFASILKNDPEYKNAEADKQRESYIEYEKKHLDEFRLSQIVKDLNEHSVCIDLGANIGNVSAVFADQGAEVYAFEPHPIAFKALEQKFFNNPKVFIKKRSPQISMGGGGGWG